jgi:CheY-like chemotaxis protein
MVVEDDQDSRDAIVTVIQSLGYETVAFESAVEALKQIDTLKISIALIDIMMPVMNGIELMQAIRNKPELSGLPIILVTARAEDDDMLEGYKFGADYYIPKPFTAKQIEYGLKLFL